MQEIDCDLRSVTVPDGVTSIGNNAFRDCTNLTAVTFLGDAPKDGGDVFFGTSHLWWGSPPSTANPKPRAGVILLQEGQ